MLDSGEMIRNRRARRRDRDSGMTVKGRRGPEVVEMSSSDLVAWRARPRAPVPALTPTRARDPRPPLTADEILALAAGFVDDRIDEAIGVWTWAELQIPERVRTRASGRSDAQTRRLITRATKGPRAILTRVPPHERPHLKRVIDKCEQRLKNYLGVPR